MNEESCLRELLEIESRWSRVFLVEEWMEMEEAGEVEDKEE